MGFGNGRDEGHESCSTEELGDEDGGVGLGLSGVDPLEAGSENARLAASLSENSAAVTTHLSKEKIFRIKRKAFRRKDRNKKYQILLLLVLLLPQDRKNEGSSIPVSWKERKTKWTSWKGVLERCVASVCMWYI